LKRNGALGIGHASGITNAEAEIFSFRRAIIITAAIFAAFHLYQELMLTTQANEAVPDSVATLQVNKASKP
jgi:membrane protease YdiL (CAAX protease family)